MSVAPVRTLIVTDEEETTPVLAEPVRLMTPEGKPFTGSVDSIDWSKITGKPATFPAAAPSWSSITGKPATFPADAPSWSSITGKPATFPAAAPSWASITGKPAKASAIADPAAEADAAAVAATLKKVLAALRTWGIIAT